MDLLKIGLMFGVIVVLLVLKKPLWQAIIGGIVALAVEYQIMPWKWPGLVASVFTTWGSLSVLLSIYFITYLQRMLEARKQIKLASEDLDGLFHNRRVNATVAPLFIGLLPSAAAMILCADLVKEATKNYLKPIQQAFITTWFRHIPESSLPTYASVLLMSSMTGVPLVSFIPNMIIPIIALVLIGYFPLITRIPTDPGTPVSENRGRDFLNLLKHLWTLLAILFLILYFKLGVVPAVIAAIMMGLVYYRFSLPDIGKMFLSAFEKKLLLNSFLVLIMRNFISETGALERLPGILSGLPIPTYLIFVILFFIGGVVCSTTGIIALGTPIAFSTLDGGMPLMVLLMGIAHAAAQISPTHVCLVVASEQYGVSMGQIIRQTIPRSLLFCGFMVVYYNVLLLFK